MGEHVKRTPLRRKTAIRRTAMRRGVKASKYTRRPRDTDYLAFVRSQVCSVIQEWPNKSAPPSPCWGPIDPDHDSRGRAYGHKSDDSTAIPLCRRHHEHRHLRTGPFRGLTRLEVYAWVDRAQKRTQANWAERNGEVPW